jgi:hypothetical protein
MKKLISLSIFFFSVFAFSYGQASIKFDKTLHDFGKVNEGDGPVSYNFTFKNTGTSPLIIQDVKTTCGCTTPEWTKQPIRPGAEGFIKVSYDVKGRPGTIDKTITVYSNGQPSPTSLRINGEVIPVERHPAEAFRYTAGTIRLDDLHVAFNRVYSHEKPELTVTAYNPGPEPVKISFIDLPVWIKVDIEPATINKEEKARIKVSYDASKKNEWGFVTDRISMVLNDEKDKDYKLTVTASIEEDFSRWTAVQLRDAPIAVLDKPVIDAGQIKKNEIREYTVRMTNTGKSKLLIRRTDANSPKIEVSAPKEISPGTSADMIIRYDTSGQSGEQSKVIGLITNDPKNSNISIRLRAEIVN